MVLRYDTLLPLLPSSSPRHHHSVKLLAVSSKATLRLQPPRACCVAGAYSIPHPNKIEKGGEDAFFVDQDAGVLAIADGVSGWAEKNVDPSFFSRQLIQNLACFLREDEVNDDPQTLIRRAHEATTSIGSATLIIAALRGDGLLKVASVGDCGLKIVRDGRIVFSTSPQEHFFDCPYQLSSEALTQTYLDAMVSHEQLQTGDIIVMGSDGLFDNVFDEELVSTVTRYNDASEAAKALANLARSHSLNSNFESPYALEARSKGFDVPWWKKMIGGKLSGGKLDDITVVVGRVQCLAINGEDRMCIS